MSNDQHMSHCNMGEYEGEFITCRAQYVDPHFEKDELRTVFIEGEHVNQLTFDEVRANAEVK